MPTLTVPVISAPTGQTSNFIDPPTLLPAAITTSDDVSWRYRLAFHELRQLHIDFDITEFFDCFDDILLQPNAFESMISSLSFIVKSRPKLETFSIGWTRIWSNRNNTKTLEKRLQKAKKIFLDGIRAGCGEGCLIKADIYGNLA